MTRRDDEYAAALDRLEALRAAGQVTPGVYDVKRAALLAEAAQKPDSFGIWLLKSFAYLAVLVVVLLVVLFVYGVLAR